MANVKITVEMSPAEYNEWASLKDKLQEERNKPLNLILNERYPMNSTIDDGMGEYCITYYDLEHGQIIDVRSGPATDKLIAYLKKEGKSV